MKAKDASAKKADAVLDDVDALRAGFRREDQALARAGRAREVLEKNVALLGWDPKGERRRLLSINGIRFRT